MADFVSSLSSKDALIDSFNQLNIQSHLEMAVDGSLAKPFVGHYFEDFDATALALLHSKYRTDFLGEIIDGDEIYDKSDILSKISDKNRAILQELNKSLEEVKLVSTSPLSFTNQSHFPFM